jgi:HEAT repeat protein
VASAQRAPAPGSPESTRPDAPAPSSESGVTLRSRVGVERAKALIGVEDELAIERLGALGTDAALQELAKIAESPSNLSERALLLLAQALAEHASHPQGVRSLYALIARGANDSGTVRAGKLVSMARAVAAMALARGGSEDGLGLLARMVKRGHEEGELATHALLAHPPRDLAPVLESPGLPNVAMAELLEGLGDQRAFVPLREMVRRGSPDVQARAALALTRLGHLETVELAHHWLAKSRHRGQRRAATEILLQTRDAKASSAWGISYADDPEAAVELALNYPLAALEEPLLAAFEKSGQPRFLTLLGHTGSERAVKVLAEQLGKRGGAAAAFALARSPAGTAADALESAQSSKLPAARRLAVFGLVLRRQWLGQGPEPSSDLLSALVKSKSPEDRWAAVWARSMLNADYAEAQLESPSLVVLAAAMATAGVQPKSFHERAVELLVREKDALRRDLLSVALLSAAASDGVPSLTLSTLIDSGSPLSSLAVRALAERVDPRFEAKIDALLRSTNVSLRSSAALGLGKHPKPEATGQLVDALRFETEPEVRLAIVSALSHRESAPARDAALQVARDLDVDARVRAAARLALAGQRLSPSATGSEVTLVEIPEGDVPDWVLVSAAGAPVLVVPTGGQRVLPIVGIRSGDMRVRLAPPTPADDDTPSDAPQAKAPRAKR